MTTVVCVLNSGGDFTPQDAVRLYHLVDGNATIPFTFLCLTDIPEQVQELGITSVALRRKYEGWWAKVEMFRFTGPTVYFDLDTVIIGDIDPLLKLPQTTKRDFYMLSAFSREHEFASGVVAWNGNFNHISRDYDGRGGWDQIYILEKAQEVIQVKHINEHFPGIYSYKRHCRNGVPEDARVICFHGKPRPGDITPFWDEPEMACG